MSGNHSIAHSPDIDGKPARAVFELNYSIIPLRPAGAGWSTVNDMLKYVSMELANGALPDGSRYISKGPLLARRDAKVPIGKDAVYGMGLMVDTTYEVPVVHHGGDMIGFHSDMMWLPEQQVGAVVLTNGDPGWLIRSGFRRKLQEVLFDGHPEADADLAAAAKTFFAQIAADRKTLVVPANAQEAAKLGARYKNAALGELAVQRSGPKTVFDFGEWQSEVASRRNPGRHDVVHHDLARRQRVRVRGRRRREEDADAPRCAARVRVRVRLTEMRRDSLAKIAKSAKEEF